MLQKGFLPACRLSAHTPIRPQSTRPICAWLLPQQTRWLHSSKSTLNRHRQSLQPLSDAQRDRKRWFSQGRRSSDQRAQGQEPAPEDDAYHHYHQNVYFIQQPRYLRPFIFTVVLSGSIYLLCAYLKAKKELEPVRVNFESLNPFGNVRVQGRDSGGTPWDVLSRAWRDTDPVTKTSCGLISTFGAVHLAGMAAPGLMSRFWHVPVLNNNYTLFTSTFVHSGGAHLLFNSLGCWMFLKPVGYSPTFQGDANHVLAFFLSAGVISAYADHLSSLLPSRAGPLQKAFIPTGGASGAVLAMFSVFCLSYPNAGVGLLFIPFVSIPASNMLALVLGFDAYGMLRGIPGLNWAHAAHLGGMLLGMSYTYLDGNKRVWRPLVDFWKRRLQQ
ncbi:hypothetical protein M011DRAFT_464984 [Sporormia fimetaria CBS 119925]|uniref:Peptidase S54 rhomboid domain-containing protein n=1 Tax=Sporormia fimetaria CBS 119925 TaxID=1340428 RepID=A0A6A6VHV9_9PLEO|nr:hypothetical protein M011DRAFT_464984 [Sporormia fimetaria CBS 119925]